MAKKKIEEVREDKFSFEPTDVKVIKPQCKTCERCIIDNGLRCSIYNRIPMEVRMNKVKCEDHIEIEE